LQSGNLGAVAGENHSSSPQGDACFLFFLLRLKLEAKVHIPSGSDVLPNLDDQHSHFQNSSEDSVPKLDSHGSDPEPYVLTIYILANNPLRRHRLPDSGFQQHKTQAHCMSSA